MASKRKKLFITLVLLLLLPVGLIVVAIQPFFIKSVILPRVEKITESQISVESIKLSPFSSLRLSGLKYEQNDETLKVQAASANIRYNLMAILRGTVVVDEITLSNPEVEYKLVESDNEKEGTPEKSSADSPRLEIQNITVSGGKLKLHLPTGSVYLSDIDFSLPELRNGSSAHPTLNALISASKHGTPDNLFMQGALNADLEMMLSDDLMPTTLKGQLEAEIGKNQADMPEMTLKVNTDLSLNLAQGVLDMKALSVTAIQSGSPLLGINLSNPTQVNWQQQPPVFTDTKLSLKIPGVEIPNLPFAQLLPVQSGQVFLDTELTVSNSGKEIQAHLDFGLARLVVVPPENEGKLSVGSFNGKGKLTWAEGQELLAVLQLDVEKVLLPDGRKLPSPLSFRLDTQAQATRAKMNDLKISWAETPGFTNHIELRGDIDWTHLKALTGQLTLRSDAVDLDPWAELIQASTPGELPDGQAAPPVVKATKQDPNQALILPTLPLERIALDLEIGRVRFKQISLEQIKLKTQAGARQLKIDNASLSLNGSPLKSAARLDWQNPEIEMDLQATLSPLDLEPVVDSILPGKKGAVTGILQGKTNFKLKGKSPSELQNSFQGALNAGYKDGKLKLLDSGPEQTGALFHTRKIVRDILSAMANALQLSPEQLMEPEIESVSFDSEVNFKDLTLRKFEILNPEFLLRAQGQIALDADAQQAKIGQLPVTLGLGTNLAKRVKVYRPERVEGAYVVLPSFIEVTGSLGAPEIKVKKSVITGLVISGVTERNKLGNENVQAGLEVLGSILSGEPIPVKTPVPEPTPRPGVEPTPTPKPGKTEQVLEGLQLFQQLLAKPTPLPKPE